VDALSWLVYAWVVAAQVGFLVVVWRLLVWLFTGRNPWREPPRWLWRRRVEGGSRPGL
jgi:hypothetical protein